MVSGKNPAVIQNTLSIELNAIRGWLEENNVMDRDFVYIYSPIFNYLWDLLYYA